MVGENENFSVAEFRTRLREYLERGECDGTCGCSTYYGDCTCPIRQHWYVHGLVTRGREGIGFGETFAPTV